jgi:hypothetical protein
VPAHVSALISAGAGQDGGLIFPPGMTREVVKRRASLVVNRH